LFGKRIILLALIIILILVSGLVCAEEEKETVYVKAEHLKYKDKKTILEGNINIRKKDIELSSSTGEINKEKTILKLYEDVVAISDNGQINSEELIAMLEEDKYIFKKEVVFDYVEKEEEDNDSFTMQTPYLIMLDGGNSFEAEQGVEILYNEKNLKSKKAKYSEETKLLVMEGDVMIEEDGDWIKSDTAEFNIGSEKEEFTADGSIEIELQI